MDKLLYSGSIAIAVVLIAGSILIPNDSLMWLASTSTLMNVVRVVVIGLMLALIFTDPPRSKQLRTVLAVAAGAFAGWAIARAFSGTVQVVDALLFLQAAVSFGLAAIEAPLPMPEPVPDNAFADMIEAAIERKGEMSLRQRMAVSLLALQLLYRTRNPSRPHWVDMIVHHTNGRIANAHSP
jgi:hypothetical protein